MGVFFDNLTRNGVVEFWSAAPEMTASGWGSSGNTCASVSIRGLRLSQKFKAEL
jgi:hypothetical protein